MEDGALRIVLPHQIFRSWSGLWDGLGLPGGTSPAFTARAARGAALWDDGRLLGSQTSPVLLSTALTGGTERALQHSAAAFSPKTPTHRSQPWLPIPV